MRFQHDLRHYHLEESIPFSMNQISQLLPLTNVIVDLDVSSKKRVFEQAGLLFENTNQIARSQVFDSLFAREKLGSTGLGQGVAIPHGRIKGLREAIAALHDGVLVGERGVDGQLKPRMVTRVLAACESAEGDDLTSLIALLRRFSVEAARDEARMFCDDLVANDDVVLPRLTAETRLVA